MKSGKFQSYVLYAIGEIVLIVAGILIAIQVNGWYGNQLLRADEKEYLQKIRSDLQDDISLLNAVIDQHELLLTQYDTLRTILDKPQRYNVSDIQSRLISLLVFDVFTPNRTTFDNLISASKVGLIRSDQITEELFLYYRQVDIKRSGIDAGISSYHRNIYAPFIMSFEFINGDRSVQRSVEEFADSPMFVNTLFLNQNMFESQIADYRELITRAESITSKIGAVIG